MKTADRPLYLYQTVWMLEIALYGLAVLLAAGQWLGA